MPEEKEPEWELISNGELKVGGRSYRSIRVRTERIPAEGGYLYRTTASESGPGGPSVSTTFVPGVTHPYR